MPPNFSGTALGSELFEDTPYFLAEGCPLKFEYGFFSSMLTEVSSPARRFQVCSGE